MICQFLHEWHVNAAKKGDFVPFCWIFQNAGTPFRENKKKTSKTDINQNGMSYLPITLIGLAVVRAQRGRKGFKLAGIRRSFLKTSIFGW